MGGRVGGWAAAAGASRADCLWAGGSGVLLASKARGWLKGWMPPHSDSPAHLTFLLPCCRSPELWDEPNTFNPDRFPVDSPVPNETTHDFKYLPFGGGKRKCIGE